MPRKALHLYFTLQGKRNMEFRLNLLSLSLFFLILHLHHQTSTAVFLISDAQGKTRGLHLFVSFSIVFFFPLYDVIIPCFIIFDMFLIFTNSEILDFLKFIKQKGNINFDDFKSKRDKQTVFHSSTPLQCSVTHVIIYTEWGSKIEQICVVLLRKPKYTMSKNH